MTSNYSRDPRVPPVQIGHLGKHHRSTPHGPVGLPVDASASEPVGDPGVGEAPRRPSPSDGPTYGDFLEAESANVEVPDKTG